MSGNIVLFLSAQQIEIVDEPVESELEQHAGGTGLATASTLPLLVEKMVA